MDDQRTNRASSVKALWQAAILFMVIGSVMLFWDAFYGGQYFKLVGAFCGIWLSVIGYRQLKNKFPTT